MFGISIPSEIHLALFLIGDILLMVYVFHHASRAREAEIRFAAARQALWFIKNGVVARPSEDESELAYELRVAIEFVRFGDEGHRTTGRTADQVQRARVSLEETLDTLETARRIYNAVLHWGDAKRNRRPGPGRTNPRSKTKFARSVPEAPMLLSFPKI